MKHVIQAKRLCLGFRAARGSDQRSTHEGCAAAEPKPLGIEQMLGFAGSAPDMDTSKQKTALNRATVSCEATS